MIEEGFINKLNLLNENNFFDNLEIKRGIEREALRVDTVGKISQKAIQRNSVPLYVILILRLILLKLS